MALQMTKQTMLRPLAPRWRKGPTRLEGDVLVLDAPRGEDYDPLTKPNIGLELVRVTDAEAAVRFATEFGLLRRGYVEKDVLIIPQRESLSSFLDAARTLNRYMTTILDVRDGEQGDREALARLRREFVGGPVRERRKPREWHPPSEHVAADTDDRTLLLHASEWATWQISIGLKEARIFVFDRGVRGENVPPGNLRVGVLPTTLLDVCYMQIATTLADREPVEVCRECRRVFLMDDARQKFCTPKCASRFRFVKHKNSPRYKKRRKDKEARHGKTTRTRGR
jgi:hypothetical protein